MSFQCLVFVRANGSTERVLVDAYPERWIVRSGVPFQRGDIAWEKEEGEAEPHGAMVYVEVPRKRYDYERERQREDVKRANEELSAMPPLP